MEEDQGLDTGVPSPGPRVALGVGGKWLPGWPSASRNAPAPLPPSLPQGEEGGGYSGSQGTGSQGTTVTKGPRPRRGRASPAHGLSSSPVCHFFLYKLGVQPGWSFSSPCFPFFPRGERPQNTTQPWLPQAHGEQAPFSPLVSATVVKPRVGKASADILQLPGRTDRQAKTHSPRPRAPSGLRAAFSLDSWRPDCGP